MTIGLKSGDGRIISFFLSFSDLPVLVRQLTAVHPTAVASGSADSPHFCLLPGNAVLLIWGLRVATS